MNRSKVNLGIFLWTLVIFALDQLSKQLVVMFIPLDSPQAWWSFRQGMFNLIHIRNENIAFSIGRNLPQEAKFVLFIVVAGVILLFIALTVLYDRQLSQLQRRLFAVVLGGGLGNLFDRIFRQGGVVDFLDVDIPNINLHLGAWQMRMDRWPVFNLADSSIVVAMILLLLSLMFKAKQRGKEKS